MSIYPWGRGRKQSPEHVRKKALAVTGERNGQWAGDDISWDGGHQRARRLYPDPGMCKRCGKNPAERHHKDGNHANNDPSNIEFLCRKCHMKADGRLDRLRKMARAGGLARQAKRRAEAAREADRQDGAA